MQEDIFDNAMTPSSLDKIVGRESLLHEKSLIKRSVKNGYPLSLILHGPPGSGKTTLAKLYAASFKLPFHYFSAASSSLSAIKAAVKKIQDTPLLASTPIFFIDEFHRLNKPAQDFFLNLIENRSIILLAATTENPSFVVNPAILSRTQTLALTAFKPEDLDLVINHFLLSFDQFSFGKEAKKILNDNAGGDIRQLLWQLKTIYNLNVYSLDKQALLDLNFKPTAVYDNYGNHHFEHLSAMQKSIRTSDPDAALYYLARMVSGGEDPRVIFRRLIRIALEDVGLSDPSALHVTLQARDSYELLGNPEGELAIAHAAIYLALSPKSNTTMKAWDQAKKSAHSTSHLSPPDSIKNHGGSADYIYDHNTEAGCSGQNTLPKQLGRPSFYTPTSRGFEKTLTSRLNYFKSIRDHYQGIKKPSMEQNSHLPH